MKVQLIHNVKIKNYFCVESKWYLSTKLDSFPFSNSEKSGNTLSDVCSNSLNILISGKIPVEMMCLLNINYVDYMANINWLWTIRF